MKSILSIIEKKRDGYSLNDAEVEWFVDQYSKNLLPDYQASALLMAICINGMDRNETKALTLAMARSGKVLDLSEIFSYTVDKHSSGGVGDKTTLVVLPLIASCGVPVVKMSGRGLGFAGGTIDKLESIPGLRLNYSESEFRTLAQCEGLVLASQTLDLAPADGKIYALRDVTGTVPSIPLIASSIMSKKLAAGANGIVLDVKVGSGAFMKSLPTARELAERMVMIGVDAKRDMVAVLSNMDQPLGSAVGNSLEVLEAVSTLKNEGPEDFQKHCLTIAAHMLVLAGQGERWLKLDENIHFLENQLENGLALAKFRSMIVAQGGDDSFIDDPTRLPQAKYTEEILAPTTGSVTAVHADLVGNTTIELGATRLKKSDTIDLAVGIMVHVKVGNRVQRGDKLFTIYANDQQRMETSKQLLLEAIQIASGEAKPLPLFHETLYGSTYLN